MVGWVNEKLTSWRMWRKSCEGKRSYKCTRSNGGFPIAGVINIGGDLHTKPPLSATHRRASWVELSPRVTPLLQRRGKGTQRIVGKESSRRVSKPSQDIHEWKRANNDGEYVQNLQNDLRGNSGRPRELENKPNHHGRAKAWRKPRSDHRSR
ncbi:hypothetical protein ASPVEDRAFT_665585 [Aspergillus versicolor CBS 583.65]|uniref:Uncharacterized protein n=1 Tax=Aspergillus versicolor CBS 583.65 TaxID=1036611 RepID=A0A1L9PL98_ASPVE|nr:uncharacterized protein ASPVEDRAFT_665585 [Aspergillus versicolor CBS 583.65]OJJ02263.1 hypothetical protein ASPVEDRAFT_665585 [Aspergillus versicolor CBS 583.65]